MLFGIDDTGLFSMSMFIIFQIIDFIVKINVLLEPRNMLLLSETKSSV